MEENKKVVDLKPALTDIPAKKLLSDIMFFSSTDLNISGKRTYRANIKAKDFGVYKSIMDKLRSTIIMGYTPNENPNIEPDNDEVVWISWADANDKDKAPTKTHILKFEQQTEDPILFTREENDLILKLYQDRLEDLANREDEVISNALTKLMECCAT